MDGFCAVRVAGLGPGGVPGLDASLELTFCLAVDVGCGGLASETFGTARATDLTGGSFFSLAAAALPCMVADREAPKS